MSYKVIYVSIPVSVDLIEDIKSQNLNDNPHINSFIVLKHGFPGLSVKETSEEILKLIQDTENASKN